MQRVPPTKVVVIVERRPSVSRTGDAPLGAVLQGVLLTATKKHPVRFLRSQSYPYASETYVLEEARELTIELRVAEVVGLL